MKNEHGQARRAALYPPVGGKPWAAFAWSRPLANCDGLGWLWAGFPYGCVRPCGYFRGQGRGQTFANLVGQGVGGGLKAGSAERERCNLFAAFKAPLVLPVDERLSPLAACGLSDTERPAFVQSVPEAQVGEGSWFSRWCAVKWWQGLLAWALAVSKRLGVLANLPACVCSGCGLAPNRACSGHGFAVGSPWGLVGRSSVACRGVGRLRRAADAIVGRWGLW